MKVNNLKEKLNNTINQVNQLPNDYKLFNKYKVQESLLKYVIFIEEYEQMKKNNKLKKDNGKNELLIINEYLDMIDDAIN